MRTEEGLQRFAALVQRQQEERRRKEYPDTPEDYIRHEAATTIRPGKRWIKVDVGTSGKFMVDEDGTIYGIKGYGVPHMGHCYGTLDTIADWWWGEYHPMRLEVQS